MKFEGAKYKREKAAVVDNWLATRNKPAPADPKTDAVRFELACQTAHQLALKSKYDIAVFKSSYGFYFTREAVWCEAGIEKLYIAKATEDK